MPHGPSISELFDHGDPPTRRARSDTTRLGGSALRQATADSIFAALGRPPGEVFLDPNMGIMNLGSFRRDSGEIRINPFQTERELGATLAHEMAHARAGPSGVVDPEIGQLAAMFHEEFGALPFEKRQRLIQDEYGEQADSTIVEAITSLGRRSHEGDELLAETFETAFDLARRANPDDPSEIRGELREAEGVFPAILPMFNFFMRRFQGMDQP